MVRANLERKFPFGSFACHLHKPWTNRFAHVNDKPVLINSLLIEH